MLGRVRVLDQRRRREVTFERPIEHVKRPRIIYLGHPRKAKVERNNASITKNEIAFEVGLRHQVGRIEDKRRL